MPLIAEVLPDYQRSERPPVGDLRQDMQDAVDCRTSNIVF